MPKMLLNRQQGKVKPMKEPNGKYLLELLISLLAEQEGVKIQYELEGVSQ